MKQAIGILLIFALLASCAGKEQPAPEPEKAIHAVPPIVVCDTFKKDNPPIKNYKTALSVWLETTSLDWFLEKRQSAWRQAFARHKKTIPVDSNALIKCLCREQKDIFLYIPNHFYHAETNGNEYFEFFIVNNTNDSINLPMIDGTIDHIGSSVSVAKENEPQQWLSFQQTGKLVECGNSFWTMKLPPHTAVAAQMDSYYLNMGDAAMPYRVELFYNGRKIVSNSIGIHLMNKQIPFLGKSFTDRF